MNLFRFSIFLILFPFVAYAQERETFFGSSLSLEIEKELTQKLDISFEEELRLLADLNFYDRLMSDIGLNYSLIDKQLKIGAHYCYIHMFNTDFLYENRHRYYLFLSYKHDINKFTLSWRGRLQGTYRDESRGAYKINPKYALRNKFEVAYSIFGSPWKPYLSCELTNSIHDPLGDELYKMRMQGGASWRLDRTTYLEFFLRTDEYFIGNDPRVISVGVGYKMKL